MSRYYYLGCALPTISLEGELEVSSEDFKIMLDMNLSEFDKQKLKSLKLENDLRNLKAVWLNQPVDSYGNYDEAQLEETFLAQQDLPEFVIDFLQEYESTEDRIKYFSYLMVHFYKYAIENFQGFLFEYFNFSRELRITLTALRAKAFNKDLEKQFQFEDVHDPFVAYLLAQKDAENIEVDSKYAEVKDLFKEHLKRPKDLHKAILKYQFDRIEEMEREHPFAIDEILGYYIRLMIVESWQKIHSKMGEDLLNQIARQ